MLLFVLTERLIVHFWLFPEQATLRDSAQNFLLSQLLFLGFDIESPDGCWSQVFECLELSLLLVETERLD